MQRLTIVGAALCRNVSTHQQDGGLVGEHGTPSRVTPELTVPRSDHPGMTGDLGSRPFDSARYVVSRQLPASTNEDLDAVRRHGDCLNEPLARPALVAQVPLAEFGGSGYFEQLSAAVGGTHDVIPLGGVRPAPIIHTATYVLATRSERTQSHAADDHSRRARVVLRRLACPA